MQESNYLEQSNYFHALFTSLGKKYETLVYERARRAKVQAQRVALKLTVEPDADGEAKLREELELTERLLAVMAESRTK